MFCLPRDTFTAGLFQNKQLLALPQPLQFSKVTLRLFPATLIQHLGRSHVQLVKTVRMPGSLHFWTLAASPTVTESPREPSKIRHHSCPSYKVTLTLLPSKGGAHVPTLRSWEDLSLRRLSSAPAPSKLPGKMVQLPPSFLGNSHPRILTAILRESPRRMEKPWRRLWGKNACLSPVNPWNHGEQKW